MNLRAGLDYGEEVHRSVKNFRPKTILFEATVGMADKMETTIQKRSRFGVLWRSSSSLRV
jgi:hypothetical protein